MVALFCPTARSKISTDLVWALNAGLIDTPYRQLEINSNAASPIHEVGTGSKYQSNGSSHVKIKIRRIAGTLGASLREWLRGTS